jgi:hypothetical protein
VSDQRAGQPRDPGTTGAPTGPEHHSAAVQRARADIAAGREWKARDRLVGHLADRYDAEALELLGEVHYAMRDLPSAGAAWFGTARRGKDVDEAVEAWRERHADQFGQMWRSLPRTVRDREGNKRVDALRARAERDAPAPMSAPAPAKGGVDAAVVIAVLVGVLFVACALVGLVTVLRWIVPG